jgi:hypothetical protein
MVGSPARLHLVVVAPLLAEFASGNLPIIYVWLLVLYAPLYGGAALLIRELGRRSARPWAVILTLGLAYGVFEEAFVSFSLFNPDYADLRLLDFGRIPALGIGAWWTVFVVVLQRSLVDVSLWLDLLGDLTFAAIATGLVVIGWQRTGSPPSDHRPGPATARGVAGEPAFGDHRAGSGAQPLALEGVEDLGELVGQRGVDEPLDVVDQ